MVLAETLQSREQFRQPDMVGSKELPRGELERYSCEGKYSRAEVGRLPGSLRTDGCSGDNFFVSLAHDLYCVFDGVGASADAEGSLNAAQLMQEAVEQYSTHLDDAQDVKKNSIFLSHVIHHIQQELKKLNKGKRQAESYFSTMTLAVMCGDSCVIASVGDSPAFIQRPGKELEQITIPHDVRRPELERKHIVPAKIDEVTHGQLSPEDVQAIREAQATDVSPIVEHNVSNFLGKSKFDIGVPFDIYVRKIGKGDRIVICSDGIPKEVSPAQIQRVLDPRLSAKQCENILMNMAKRNDADGTYHDDRTAILIEGK